MRNYRFAYRTPVDNHDPLLTKQCRRCGAQFQTKARTKKRCNACQDAIQAIRDAGYNAKARAQRAGGGR